MHHCFKVYYEDFGLCVNADKSNKLKNRHNEINASEEMIDAPGPIF